MPAQHISAWFVHLPTPRSARATLFVLPMSLPRLPPHPLPRPPLASFPHRSPCPEACPLLLPSPVSHPSSVSLSIGPVSVPSPSRTSSPIAYAYPAARLFLRPPLLPSSVPSPRRPTAIVAHHEKSHLEAAMLRCRAAVAAHQVPARSRRTLLSCLHMGGRREAKVGAKYLEQALGCSVGMTLAHLFLHLLLTACPHVPPPVPSARPGACPLT